MSKKRKHTLTTQQKKDHLKPQTEEVAVQMEEPVQQQEPEFPPLDWAHIIEKNPFAQLLGMELLEVREGYVYGRMRMDEHFSNIYGGMHGGCIYALADTFAGIAASTYGNYVTTIDGKMNYLEPVNDTPYVYCEVHVQRQGGKIGVYTATITDGAGHVFASADFTYYRMSKSIDWMKNSIKESNGDI